MRLIDADAIKLPKGFFEKVDNVPKFYEWLDEQPIIDAVEVVRCIDCRWWSDKNGGFCDILGLNINDDEFFCAWGERRAKDEGSKKG